MATALAVTFFVVKILSKIGLVKRSWLFSSLALSLASFCLAYFREADSVALQRVWAIAENRWK